ncbi:MAG: IPT/TIG domain-containing protein [Dehalococcoidia bacterium]
MKRKRLFGILSIAVVLALLMTVIPAIPVSAAPVVIVDVEKASIGDKVTVSGTGFTPSTPPDHLYNVDIYFSVDELEVGEDISYYDHFFTIVNQYVYTDDTGSFSKLIEIPEMLTDGDDAIPVQGGTYYFYVTYGGHEEIKAYEEFTVLGISDISPAVGTVGTEVELSGVGFDGRDAITILFDGIGLDITGGDRGFKNNGSFSSQVVVPPGIAGEHTITVEDEGDHSGQVEFTIEPGIILSPTMASSNQEVIITGHGFGADVDIFVYFDGAPIYIIGDSDTDDQGSFVTNFSVPEMEPGEYLVEVEDDSFNVAQATLEVGAGLIIEPVTSVSAPGSVGDTVNISGSGFVSDTEVEIKYDGTVVATVTTGSDGDLSKSITIPCSSSGEHTISVSDGTNSQEVLFYVEATAPPVPTLISPETDTEADSMTEFSWEGVTDDSMPMTYELQVATDSQFSPETVLVSKIEIAATTYTLSEAEELESLGEDAPYYWRVRAKDAASNTSAWASGIRFTVGSTFHMPTWLTYLLIGIGAVLVFFLGLWLGRRSSVSDDYYY